MKRQIALIAVFGIILAGMSGQVLGQKKSPDKESPRKAGPQAPSAVLEEPIDMAAISQGELNLKELLAHVRDRLAAKGKELPIFVDALAFKQENPDAQGIYDTAVRFDPIPKKQKLGMILRQALGRVQTNNATFLLRGGLIEITTFERAKPESLLGFPITARFNKHPLDEAIDELSDLSGATIIIDSRVGDKAKAPVSASFKNTITLESAVRLLAEMADLQAEMRDNILFITGKAKGEGAPQKSALHFKGRRLDLALRDLANWSGANIVLDPRYLPPPTPIFQGKQKQVEAAALDPLEKQPETVALQVGGLGFGGMAAPYEPPDPRNMKVTASFNANVSAEMAARILANQVRLSVVIMGNVLYVTDPINASRLFLEKSGKYPNSGFFLPGIGN
jgi:hypothetical protein